MAGNSPRALSPRDARPQGQGSTAGASPASPAGDASPGTKRLRSPAADRGGEPADSNKRVSSSARPSRAELFKRSADLSSRLKQLSKQHQTSPSARSGAAGSSSGPERQSPVPSRVVTSPPRRPSGQMHPELEPESSPGPGAVPGPGPGPELEPEPNLELRSRRRIHSRVPLRGGRLHGGKTSRCTAIMNGNLAERSKAPA